MTLIILILVIFILFIIFFNYRNISENFQGIENVNINTLKKIKVFNSDTPPSKNVEDYEIIKKSTVNADKEKFIIKYPLKYDKFVEMKKDKIAQCISAVEESYNYPDSDIDSYIKKTEIPTCPEIPNMNLYLRKIDIPTCPQIIIPDMDLYIKKTDIPVMPDMNLYVKKSNIPKCPDISSYIKKTDIHKYLNVKPILYEPKNYEKKYW